MRSIGNVDGEAGARKFSDFLFVQGIENQIEPEPGGAWAVWIKSEEELERAKTLLAGFQQNPADAKYESTAQAARALREQQEQEQKAYENRIKGPRQLFQTMTAYGFGPLTFLLIAASVVVFIKSNFGRDPHAVYALFISDYDAVNGGLDRLRVGLPEVRHGELWRLFTPVLMHRDFLHIFFNMLWLRDLGSMIEGRQSTWLFAILVLVFGVFSNLAQYAVYGPYFLGMSGVVYGLFGYVWIRGKFDPGSGLYVHPTTVTMMIIWFFVCFTGVMGAVANVAHGAGLAIGIAWGYLSSLRHR